MRREISILLQPRWILPILIATILLILFLSVYPRGEETAEEVPEITHRVFLDIDIDEQHIGRIVIGLYGNVVPKTAGMCLIFFMNTLMSGS